MSEILQISATKREFVVVSCFVIKKELDFFFVTKVSLFLIMYLNVMCYQTK